MRSNTIGGRLGRTAGVVAAALLLPLTACSETTSGNSRAVGSFTYAEGMVGPADDPGEARNGGTLTYGAFMEPLSLDPATSIAAASTGGNEMTSIYDTLTRYDASTREFVPQLAKSLSHDAKGTVWTLTLRPGVRFSNGEKLDAAAVKGSQERYAGFSSPEAGIWNANVKTIEVVDASTVRYTMKAPFAWLGSLLSTGPGLIVAPSSAPAGSKDFKPVGAGPFTFVGWARGEGITVKANPDYWNGRPHLDTVRFAFLGDQYATNDALANGDIDAAYFRYPDVVDELLAAKSHGYATLNAISSTMLINASKGRPGADIRVRKALQLAIDPDTIRERAYAGHGLASPRIFPKYSRWNAPDVPVLEPDPAKAEALVEEAKADGYDGQISFLGNNSPAVRNIGQAVKASLEAVGFKVRLEYLPSSTEVTGRLVNQQDYDFVFWGLNFPEGDAYTKMFSSLDSAGSRTYGMSTTPEMDAALARLRGALDESVAKQAMADVQRAYNESVPFLTWMPLADLSAWDESVHGVKGGTNSMILLDRAWKG